jgi:hypothetical protein
MMDALYILGTLAFFWLMAVYVRWCESQGRKNAQAREDSTP